ncbi:MAG: lipopolysaccharide heptosyltransferase II [Mariprofundaceae bacterium]|nr:lipopolysaccharide heptosyltransferase II [Mariprofundaceae bacterium]
MSKTTVLMPPNWLGDVVMAQPALRAIALAAKDDKLLLFGRAWLDDLLPFLNLDHADISYVETMPKHADATFLFPNSLRSALQAFAARAKQRIGFRKEGRGIFLTHPYTSRVDLMSQHHRGYYLDLLQQYGIKTPFDAVQLSTPPQEQEAARTLLEEHGINSKRVVCVAPGAQFGAAKRYPALAYAQVLAYLSDAGWDVVILGTPAEREIADICASHIQGACWNAAGQTSLRQALQLVSVSALMLCNDSGLMHVAAGMQIPTVCMFGATNPARTSPSGEHVEVLYQPAHCSPCLQRECDVQGHPCMVNIPPSMVRDACLKMLEKV